jgi:hypothetical protein
MKQTPLELRITKKMQPGVITLNGFLGNDDRHFHEIIADDEKTLEKLGYTAEQVAERMQYFTDLSWEFYEQPVEVEGKYAVETEIVRGKLPCPFSHPGVYRKAFTILTNTETGVTIRWSSLNLHLIKAHHFFEGKGSTYRLDPELLVKALF